MSTSKPAFVPWLFDNREAFEQTVADPRYRYDLPFNSFLQIYQQYRRIKQESAKGQDAKLSSVLDSVATQSSVGDSAEQSLNQADIDALIQRANQ